MAPKIACYIESMTNTSPASLSDTELLAEITRAAGIERKSTAELLTLLAEVDLRKLYLGLGYSSLFVYCTNALRMSESAAYIRIAAARTSRSFPSILTHLMNGNVTLTTVSLLASRLTIENHEALLSAASHKSRRDVERLVASLAPKPDVSSIVRRLPERDASAALPAHPSTPSLLDPAIAMSTTPAPTQAIVSTPPIHRPVLAPLSAETYLLRITLTAHAHEKLERARALLRHQVPNGDPAVIVERALTILVEQLERSKHAATERPRTTAGASVSTSRHIPAAVKRVVWERDRGRCAFIGADGECGEAGFLEFHHVIPFAAGGPTSADNLELRCRAHNAYEATLFEQSLAADQLAARMK